MFYFFKVREMTDWTPGVDVPGIFYLLTYFQKSIIIIQMTSAQRANLQTRYERVLTQISTLEDQYEAAILNIGVVQHSFGSSEGSTSATMRNPEQIRKEIDNLQAYADQLYQRINQCGVTTMSLRRNIGGGRF